MSGKKPKPKLPAAEVVKADWKEDMPEAGGATPSGDGDTSSGAEAPHNGGITELCQAFVRAVELVGTIGVNRRLRFLKMFVNLLPPEFAENHDEPLEGVEWLDRIKQCFEVMNLPEDLRVGFATFKLTRSAHYWWEFATSDRDVESITWAEFQELFLNRYFPETVKRAKCNEFQELTQGNMTVAQYESKFLELLWLVPHVVSSNKDTATKFLFGLRPLIRGEIPMFDYNTLCGVVAAAQIVEASYDASQREQEQFEDAFGIGEKRPRKQYICHNCGQPGHIRPNCPNYHFASSRV